MKILVSIFFTLILLGGTAQLCLAQTDSFNVQLMYGVDSQPPTTPAPISVTPIAATQIDIAWGTSTDNTQVIGYQLFRDAVQIATTTLTSYFDTGLTASTSYAYNVIAFDAFGNFSTSSLTLATTTFATPLPPVATTTDGVGGSATIARLQLTSFDITPSTNGAKFQFSTNIPTRFVLRYGTSSVYDDGAVEGPIYKTTHTTSLFPLESGASYVYELYGFDRFGTEVLLSEGGFSTVELPDTTAPANVANFSAIPIGTDTFLRWDNPTDDDFVFVRIVRNHLFYPLHESDGFLVYEGTANSFTDQRGLSEYDEQYYTIFTYDSSGNVSSGAIAYAATQPWIDSSSSDQEDATATTTLDNVIDDDDADLSTTDTVVLYASSVQVLQGDLIQSLSDQSVVLDSRLAYELFIPIEAVPENLKTIIATVMNPSNQRLATTYLLKLNEENTGYEARISAPMVTGSSRITIEMIDFTLGTVRKIEQSIAFVKSHQDTPPLFTTLSQQGTFPWIIRGGVILFVLFLLYIIFTMRR